MKKFQDVLTRWERRDLSAWEAGELLGCSERQFRRYRQRYEEEGLEGLIDKRLGAQAGAVREPAMTCAICPSWPVGRDLPELARDYDLVVIDGAPRVAAKGCGTAS